MPRYLALDGDTNRIQLLSASVKGDSLRLEKSLVWDEDQPISKANAATVGEQLRAKLKDAGIAAAPLLVCLGRDRVIVKELKVPPVAAHEEPAIVRFQALKELAEGGDDTVLDYVPVSAPGTERRVQVMAVKKELIVAYKKLAEVAGLKLASITPRPFAILAGLQRAIATGQVPPAGPPNAAAAVLVRGDKWGEFIVVHNGDLTIARSLAGPPLTNDTALLGEIRRNLAVHANQHPEFPVRALYLTEPDTPGGLRERMQDSLAIPVHAYEPAVGVPVPDGPPGGLAGPAGLFAIRGTGIATINFVQPRQPKPPKDSFKKVLALTGVAALLFVVTLFAFATIRISAKKIEMAIVQRRINDNRQQIREMEQDAKRIKALDEWTATDINWLDELYDATARMDTNSRSVRIRSLSANIQEDRSGKSKYAASMTLVGTTKKDPVPLNSFLGAFEKDSGYGVGSNNIRDDVIDKSAQFPIQFTTKIELQKRAPDKYTRTFKAEAPPKRSKEWPSRGPIPGVEQPDFGTPDGGPPP